MNQDGLRLLFKIDVDATGASWRDYAPFSCPLYLTPQAFCATMPPREKEGTMNDNVTISTYELLKLFPDEAMARVYLEKRRWNGHVVCPHCGCDGRITVRKGKREGYFWCRDCGREFTVRTGTIFERSHIPLDKWLLGMYLVVTSRKGISSMQLSKELSITQRSAWFLLGRLREALGSDPGSEKLKGIVEVDELFHGGRERSKPLSKRTPGGAPKQLVLGLRERGGRSVAMPIDSRKKKIIQKKIAEHVEPGSEIHTDNLASYDDLPRYVRRHVNHHVEQYVGPGDIHCNSVESMWALLRRSIHGIWHHVSVKHLQRYISEATFRLNDANVRVHTLARLDAFVALAFRCRITYKRFIA